MEQTGTFEIFKRLLNVLGVTEDINPNFREFLNLLSNSIDLKSKFEQKYGWGTSDPTNPTSNYGGFNQNFFLSTLPLFFTTIYRTHTTDTRYITSWIKIEPSVIYIPPHTSDSFEVVIVVPEDMQSKHFNEKWEAWAVFNSNLFPGGQGGMNFKVELAVKLFINTPKGEASFSRYLPIILFLFFSFFVVSVIFILVRKKKNYLINNAKPNSSLFFYRKKRN